MKTIASKEISTPSQSSQPFFNKKGEGSFLSTTNEEEQPFFSPNPGIQRNPASSSFLGGHNFSNIPIFPPRSRLVIQPKLTINEPGDKYEQEADTMADQLMRRSAPTNEDGEEKLVQSKSLNITAIQRKCGTCEEEEKVQRQEIEEEEPLQIKSLMRKTEGGGYTASSQLTSQLDSSKGGGDPLPRRTLGFMNQAFGSDFSKVRIHTGAKAAEMSEGIQAKAFTHGSDVYFNQGQYNPESSEGKRLLGHELTHTIQQSVNSFSSIQRRPAPVDKKTSKDEACDISWDDEKFRRIPPGPGALSEAQYTAWEKRHAKHVLHPKNRLSENQPFMKTAQWFWDQCFFYAGRIYGGQKDTIMEVWLSNKGEGIEYRVFASTKPIEQPKKVVQKPSQPVKSADQINVAENLAIEEARTLAEELIDYENNLTERADELKDIYKREGETQHYRDRLHELADVSTEFEEKKLEVATRFLELWDGITSEEGLEEMLDFDFILKDSFDFDIWAGDGPPHSLPAAGDEPIDFSGTK